MSESGKDQEIQAYIRRAEQSLEAARELSAKGYGAFGASRAYYAAFYAARALLLREGMSFRKHSGVIGAIHRFFVKPGLLSREQGKALNWLFEVRSMGDYDVLVNISPEEAAEAITKAEKFVTAVKELLNQSPPKRE